jgi:hypothetical protein
MLGKLWLGWAALKTTADCWGWKTEDWWSVVCVRGWLSRGDDLFKVGPLSSDPTVCLPVPKPSRDDDVPKILPPQIRDYAGISSLVYGETEERIFPNAVRTFNNAILMAGCMYLHHNPE